MISTGIIWQFHPTNPDIHDLPDENAACVSPLDSVDVREHQISAIIWATGFKADLSYLKVPVVDADGNLLHKDGISAVEGIYFVGFPWLRSRKSILLCGIKDDAEFIAKQVYNFAQTEWSATA
jgi:putative flavoprotein involved in K+ transport